MAERKSLYPTVNQKYQDRIYNLEERLSAAEARAEKAEAERDASEEGLKWPIWVRELQAKLSAAEHNLEAMRSQLSRILALTEEPPDDPLFWQDLNFSAHDVAQAVAQAVNG